MSKESRGLRGFRRITWNAMVLGLVAGCESNARMADRIMHDMVPSFDHAEHEPQTIHGVVMNDADILARPRSVEIIGEYLVISDAASEHVIHVFDRKSEDHVNSFGRLGDGPGEFMASAVLSGSPGMDSIVTTLDPTHRRVTRFRIPEGQIEPVGRTSTRQLPTLHFVYNLKMVDEHRGVGLGFFDSGRLGFFDLLNEAEDYAGDVPGDDDEPYIIRQQAYQSYLALNPARTRIAVLTRLATAIDIYDERGNHLATAEAPYRFPVDYLIDNEGNFMAGMRNRHGYKGVATTDDSIFALFSGRAEAHFRGMSGAHGEFVHEFNWDGELKRVFRLNQEVLDITVDEMGATLYAITERPQPAVLVFSVK